MTEHRQIIERTYTVEFDDGDGRTISGRCVPYGEVAMVNDGRGAYREMFQRGAFRRNVSAPHKVILDFEHVDLGILGVCGHGVSLVERDDGLYGDFRPVGAPGEQALELIRARVLTGMSVQALVMGPGRREGDVLVRTACHLNTVALCREPAYAGALLDALRTDDPSARPLSLSDLRPARNLALDERLHCLGIGRALSSDA
jgi:HK97 family phage prohead protease